MFVDGPLQIPFDDTQIFQILLFLFRKPALVQVDLFEFPLPAAHIFPVFRKFMLRLFYRLQIFPHQRIVLCHGIVQRIPPHAAHRLFNALHLDTYGIKDRLNGIRRLIVTLLFQMQLKDHLVDRQLHIILDLECRQQQIIPIIRHIIGDSLYAVFPLFHPIGNETHMLTLCLSLAVILCFKIHRPAVIGQDRINNKIRQFPAILIPERPLQMILVHTVQKSSNIIQRADFLFQ